jgi:hypothetical protein
MSIDTYAVVEFLQEKSVEVVVKSWIEHSDGVSCHYLCNLLTKGKVIWPLHSALHILWCV